MGVTLLWLGTAVESLTAQTTLVSTGSVWRYFDSGDSPGTNWQRRDFDDSAWPSGRGQFGWGDSDEATPIAADINPKPITVYFRHTFVATNTSFPTLTMRLAWDDGAVVFDQLDACGFTLLALNAGREEAAPMEQAARAIGAPLEVVAIDEPGIARLYERKFVLVRPDQHVCWRGDAIPADAARVLDTVRGAR